MASQDYLVTLIMNRDVSNMKEVWRENMRLKMYQEYRENSEGRFRPEFRDFINDILAKINDRYWSEAAIACCEARLAASDQQQPLTNTTRLLVLK